MDLKQMTFKTKSSFIEGGSWWGEKWTLKPKAEQSTSREPRVTLVLYQWNGRNSGGNHVFKSTCA